jgi:hypothetical protein
MEMVISARIVVALVLMGVLASVVSAETWYIKPDGMGDAPTIQAGLDSATAGDTVLVACGTYYEHDVLMKPGVYLTAEMSPLGCVVLDVQQQGAGIVCRGLCPSTTIDGLTITNALASAMELIGSTDAGPTVRNCVFAYNACPAVYLFISSPSFENCLFYGNYSTDPWPTATILSAYGGSYLSLSNCTLAFNSAGIAAVVSGTAAIENTIIAHCDGFSLWHDDSSYMYPVACCNFWGNASAYEDSVTAAYNPGCFVADPQFCGIPWSHNYYLQSDSPCAPGNHPEGDDCGLIGALPVKCGTVQASEKTWGATKALFRKRN